MKQKDADILSAKFGLKKISIKYYDNRVGQNRSAEETEYPLTTLITAKDELLSHLVKACHLDSGDWDKFKVIGFVVEEKDGLTTIVILGQMTNPYDYLTNIDSGKIPLDEDQKELKTDLDILRNELYKFIFESNNAQGKIPGMPTNGEAKAAEGDIPGSKQVDNFGDDNEPPVSEPADVSGDGEQA